MPPEILVKEVMNKDLVTINSKDVVSKARSILRDQGYRALPVLEDDKLVGIASRGNILKVTSTKTNVEVKGVMEDKVITTSLKENILSAGKEIIKGEIRQLPVTENGNLKGIITAMDILRALVKNNYSPHAEKIKEVMTKEVTYCDENEKLSRVWDRIHEKGYSGLPVLQKGKVIGMITRADILKSSTRLSRESGKIKNTPVKKIMRTPPRTVTSETKISQASQLMTHYGISRLPVVDKENKLQGIVDVEDILRAYV